jgi:hypothetical protein
MKHFATAATLATFEKSGVKKRKKSGVKKRKKVASKNPKKSSKKCCPFCLSSKIN